MTPTPSNEWRTIESAPKDQNVLGWLKGVRILRQDKLGQWRNMMGAPKNPPTFWMPLSPSSRGPAMSANTPDAQTTHRRIQLADLMDRASTNRVRYYVNAQRASRIGNRAAASHFTTLAQRWEIIRASCAARLFTV